MIEPRFMGFTIARTWQQAKKTAINLIFRIFDKKLNKMDLQTRKIKFVQEFLKLQSEEAISKLENLLKKEKKTDVDEHFKPMTEKELNERIDQSESDFKNNRYKRTSELLTKYE